MHISVLGEEIIYQTSDGDVFKINVCSNETDLLLKNTTFVSIQKMFKCLKDSHILKVLLKSLKLVR